MSLLLSLLPEEAWLLALQVAGLLIIIGARRTGLRILGIVCLLAFFTPFIRSLGAAMPEGVQMMLYILFPIMLLSAILRFCFGKGVWDQVVGRLIYDLIRAPFRFLGWLRQGFRRP